MSVFDASAKTLRALLGDPSLTRTLRRTKTYQTLVHWHHLIRKPGYRDLDDAARKQFEDFALMNGQALSQDVFPRDRSRKLAIVVRTHSLRYHPVQTLVIKALQMAGFETIVIGRRQFEVLRFDWLVGSPGGYTFSDFGTESDLEWIDEKMKDLRGLHDWLALEYQGVAVGRVVISTVLRTLKVGRLNYDDPLVQAQLRQMLEVCVRDTKASQNLLDQLKPDCAVFVDRGYSGQGELFDSAVNRGIEAFTWDVGYKGNRMIFKRYTARNRRDHQLQPSKDSWRRICDMPWKTEYGDAVRKELFDSYEKQEWFAAVGTQFGKQILSREKTLEELNLSKDRKIAVIFPHILWDGSFFFGEDLFDDYAEWLVETLKAACENDRIQWVVKLHPSHVVKARVENDQSKPAEVQLIGKLFDSLPAHIHLVYPDTKLSTYSLFEIADYTVTVRGTVGIESALFGIPTVTAGTGRYSNRGFTLDSESRQEYLQKLASLETFPRLTPEQCQLAERYAYAVFLCRPLALSSASLTFDREDGRATPRMVVHPKTREEWLTAPDLRVLVAWLQNGKEEDLLQFPEGADTLR